MATPAKVVQLLGRMGVKGVSKVRCKVLDGNDKEKVIIRNVVGPIKLGDIVLLKETAMDTAGRFQRKG